VPINKPKSRTNFERIKTTIKAIKESLNENDQDLEINQLTMDNNNYNSISLFQLIFKWKWHIIIITLAAAICGAIFSSSAFITPLFKSEAIAYPANISPYSEESETEQMLQIITSQSIADSIIEKYDLWTDYKIDRKDPHAKTYMMLEYQDKIKISKTPYEAISIVVNDKDPVTACNIARDIINFYDQKVNDLHHEKTAEVIVMYERQLREKQRNIDSLKTRLSQIGTLYGITDVPNQSREITRGYLSGSNKVNDMKNNIELYGSEVLDLHTKIAAEGNTFVAIKCDYERELRFYNGVMTYSNIITEPYPADKKTYPVRWVIVALSGLGALLISILAIFVIENRKKFIPAEK
jgi:uncharacterized protein involved in exopolysaccharide biosynthesis